MSRFPGVDYLLIDSQFSEQELLVRQMARQFVDERVLPLIRDCFRDARFPKELIPEMGRLGFLGANIEGYGCAGMSNVEYGLVMQEIERGDSGLRSFVSVQSALVMYPILTFGSEEQKQRWLPKLKSGEALGCFGLTEPGFGSNPAGMLTRARRDGADWVLDGEKTWITNGSVADVAVVWARAEDGIRGFLVERGTPGFTASEIHGKLSMRASVTSSLAFNNCRVPESALLPQAQGLRAPLSCLSQARYGIGWGVIGAAMDCYETARAYSVLRKQFDGRPIASHQLVQEKLADMITEITKAQLLALQVGRLKDKGQAERGPHFHAEAQQRRHSARLRPRLPRPAGRQRHHGRIPRDASHVQSRNRQNLRGDRPHSHPGDRRARDRHCCLQMMGRVTIGNRFLSWIAVWSF